MSRLTIDVTDQQHQSLKAMAALQGKTIKQYALEKLFPTSEDAAMQDLRALLEQRLAQCREGTVDMTFTEIGEDVIPEVRHQTAVFDEFRSSVLMKSTT